MENSKSLLIAFIVIVCILSKIEGQGLKLGFYDSVCPQAEKIILNFAKKHISLVPEMAAPLLRMHFHDCFVRGCDGSVLLNSTNSTAEKNATPNLTIRGFDLIDKAKTAVEKQCPGVVSCADIIALMARDSILVAHGRPFWNVPTGRRDGRISNASEALSNIPAPTSNFSQLNTSFANKGLSVKDLVILSGAHTIGIAHCSSFNTRLYNFSGNGDSDVDPSMDKFYVANLKKNKCKNSTDNSTIVEMDPGSFKTFDLSYYRLVKKRRGLFQSDAALLTDANAKAYIDQELANTKATFFSQFAKSMEKMGRVGVLTGSAGEIRKQCAFVN
ncbi:hypothetical protein SUGI_0111940 [Cryptomeria japonica]|uniref:peroxidase 3 isoform X2 n=1 Tax=Cryptomeria japonica TaxID=3369 RepID=UPI002408A0BB|nr:peroxidase 3 isoform X2 [Cryptomeria japonica]XP_057872555.2 peroxidase 3 isoform X2 [Cryptomeria japonica]GLJ09563.1 hypothetical protein SUGI_0111940 [Cryptomeria japonica]